MAPGSAEIARMGLGAGSGAGSGGGSGAGSGGESGEVEHPSRQLLKLRMTEVAAVGSAVSIAAASTALLLHRAVVATAVVAAVLAAVAVTLWFVLRRYRSWSYIQRGDDLVIVRGVMFKRTTVVPYGRMQLVDVTSGPFERLFGIATVKMHTAAAASDAKIPGLQPVKATELRDSLAALGEAKAAGL